MIRSSFVKSLKECWRLITLDFAMFELLLDLLFIGIKAESVDESRMLSLREDHSGLREGVLMKRELLRYFNNLSRSH